MPPKEPIPRGYDELGTQTHQELLFQDGEMIHISEQGIACFNEAVKNPNNVITDAITYGDISHLNGLRSNAIMLSLRGRQLTDFTVTVPRKGDSTAIRIDAKDDANPNRTYTFTEIEDMGEQLAGFEICDSDWLNAEKSNMGIDNFIESHEVANWLYRQAGLSPADIAKKLKTETDPVQDASHAVGQRAKQVISQRQIKVKVRDGLFLYGEEIAVQSPDELTLQKPSADIPTARPIRMYNLWINGVYDTEKYGGVREQITCSFSPDNPALLVPNPRSSLYLSVETTIAISPIEQAKLYQERQQHYVGNVAKIFESIQQDLHQSTV